VALVNTPRTSDLPAGDELPDASGARAPATVLDAPDAADLRPTPWTDRRLVLTGVGVALVRFAFAADRRVFHLFADEPGQLAMARWLSGGTRWTMLDHNTWRPGYALTLAPIVRVFDSGEAMVRAALTLNAVYAGVTAIVLARLVERWTRLGVGTSAAIATVTALAPTAIAASAYTWSESLITLLLVSTLWFLQRFVDTERVAHALWAVACAGLAITTHGRAASVLVTTVVICSFVLARRGRGRHVAVVVGLAAALGIASQALNVWVRDAVWDRLNDTNTTGAVVGRLDAPAALVDSMVGQVWYQLVASAGLVGIGCATAIAAFVRPRPPLDRTSAGVLLATTIPPIVLSVVFMSDRGRADQLVYGRYLDTVVWPFFALGLAVVVRRIRARASAGDRQISSRDGDEGWSIIPIVGVVMLVCGIVVAARHGDQLRDEIGLRMMVPGLLPYVGGGDGIPVITVTGIALLALTLAALAGEFRIAPRFAPAFMIGIAIVVLGFTSVRVHDALATQLNGWAIGEAVSEIDAIVPDGEPIGLVTDGRSRTETTLVQRQRYQVYQLYLPDHELIWQRGDGYSTRFVIAPLRDPGLVEADAQERWRDPEKSIALWELP
jgi:hypothetical protein